jgi:hypothetical protein
MKLILSLLSFSAAKKPKSFRENKIANKESAAKRNNERTTPAECIFWATEYTGGRSGQIKNPTSPYDINTDCSWNFTKGMGTKSLILKSKYRIFLSIFFIVDS